MPRLKALLNAVVPVVIAHGNEKITLHAKLEQAAQDPKSLENLLEQEKEIQTGLAKLHVESEALIQSATSIRLPETNDVLRFRAEIEASLRDAVGTLRDQERDMAHKVPDAIEVLESASARLDDWSMALLPTPQEIEAKQEETRTKVQKIKAEMRDLRKKQHCNRAEQVAFWCAGWDVTDEDSQGHEVDIQLSPEALCQFSPDLVSNMLVEIEKKVPDHALIL